jgi:hypothetical protein
VLFHPGNGGRKKGIKEPGSFYLSFEKGKKMVSMRKV